MLSEWQARNDVSAELREPIAPPKKNKGAVKKYQYREYASFTHATW